MIHLEGVRIALRGIAANRLRSALTVLGITIGVAAVIILIAVGHGSAVAVQNRINSLGTNVLTIFSGGGFGSFGGGRQSRIGTRSSFNSLTTKDVTALRNKTLAPDILTVSPVVNASVTATFGSASYSPSQFVGSTPTIFAARDYSIAAGTLFTSQDELDHNRVVVLGQTVVANLFGSQNPIGQTIKLNGVNFLVVGVLKAKGTNGPQDQDDIAFAPLTAVQDSLAGGNTIAQIIVQAKSSRSIDAAQNEIYNVLASTHPSTSSSSSSSSSFRVLNQSSLLEASTSTSRTFTVLLGAVAAISLLVGGIGVMNIMLVSVTERTREIGIRKAIGARHSDIVGQFLAESTMLSMLGGVAGVLAGIVGSRFTIVGVHPVVQLWSMVMAFAVAVGVGLFFGIYPANRAAMLRPIDALRYE
jgi:putative ABC transport system permease protein